MKNKSKGLILIGLLLIASALFLTAYNLREDMQAKESAMKTVARLEELLPETKAAEEPTLPRFTGTEAAEEPTLPRSTQTEATEKPTEKPAKNPTMPDQTVPTEEIEIPDYILNPDMEMPVEHIDGQDYIGVLAIPGLELKLPVISEWSYPRLKIAPCRYAGSAYTGDLIISAHNYSSHFGKLNHLHVGDTVSFTDIDGNVFHYKVMEIYTLKPTAIEEMESGDWDLTLFTCTVGGQSRVTVRCDSVKE